MKNLKIFKRVYCSLFFVLLANDPLLLFFSSSHPCSEVNSQFYTVSRRPILKGAQLKVQKVSPRALANPT